MLIRCGHSLHSYILANIPGQGSETWKFPPPVDTLFVELLFRDLLVNRAAGEATVDRVKRMNLLHKGDYDGEAIEK